MAIVNLPKIGNTQLSPPPPFLKIFWIRANQSYKVATEYMHVERSSEETQLGYTLNNRATNVIYETSVEFFSEKKNKWLFYLTIIKNREEILWELRKWYAYSEEEKATISYKR